MPNLARHVIKCPKTPDHPHDKILLLLGKDSLAVHCHEHGFIEIKLSKGGKIIDFQGVTAELTPLPSNVNFELEPIPAIAIGKFVCKKERKRGADRDR